jgi:hypothetical protein
MVTTTMRRWRVLEPAILDMDTGARAGSRIERGGGSQRPYHVFSLCVVF